MDSHFRHIPTRLGLVALTVSLVAAVMSCGGGAPTGAIYVRVSSPSSTGGRTFVPSVDMAIASVELSLLDPDGTTATVDVSGGTYTNQDAIAGTWTLAAHGYNAEGATIATAATTVAVTAEGVHEVSLVLEPLGGSGTLSLAVSWSVGALTAPSVDAAYSILDESYFEASPSPMIPLSVAVGTTTGSVESVPLDAGYYAVSVTVRDEEEIRGTVDSVVRIVAGHETHAEIDFAGGTFRLRAAMSTEVMVRSETPPEFSIVGITDPVFPTMPPRASAVGVGGEPLLARWYLNGESVAVGTEYSFPQDIAVGTHQLDAVVYDPAARSGASRASAISVESPTTTGGFALRRTVYDGEQAPGDDRSVALRDAVGAVVVRREAVDYLLVAVSGGVTVFAIDPYTGSPVHRGFVDLSASATNPVAIRSDSAGDRIFVIDAAGSVVSLHVDPADASLIVAETVSVPFAARAIEVVTDTLFVVGTDGTGETGLVLVDAAPPHATIRAYDPVAVGALPIDPVAIAASADSIAVGFSSTDTVALVRRSDLSPTSVVTAAEIAAPQPLDDVRSLIFSPDGAQLYTGAYGGRAVGRFDTAGGHLTYLDHVRDGESGVDGLYGVCALTWTPGGLLAAGSSDDALALLTLDAGGALSMGAFFDGSVCPALDRPRTTIFDGSRGLYVVAANGTYAAVYVLVDPSP